MARGREGNTLLEENLPREVPYVMLARRRNRWGGEANGLVAGIVVAIPDATSGRADSLGRLTGGAVGID